MRQNQLSKVSIIISMILLVIYVYLKVRLEIRYSNASGKTQALFGLNEIMVFLSNKYALITGFVAITFSVAGSRKKEDAKWVVSSFLFAFFILFIWYFPWIHWFF